MPRIKYLFFTLLSFLLASQLLGLQSFYSLTQAQPSEENPILEISAEDAILDVLNYSFTKESLIISFMNGSKETDIVGISVYVNMSDFVKATKLVLSVDNNALITTVTIDFCDEGFTFLDNYGTYDINRENGEIPIDGGALYSRAEEAGAYCLKVTVQINSWVSDTLYKITSNLEMQNTGTPPPEEGSQPPKLKPNANPQLAYQIEDYDLKSIAWSPSGSFILINGFYMRTDPVCYLVNASKHTVYNFTLPDSVEVDSWDTRLAMSLDETKVFFAARDWTNNLKLGIFSINMDGSDLTPIAQNLSDTSSAQVKIAVSKNDTYLVYTEPIEEHSNITSYIWKMNLSTGEKSLVVSVNGTGAITSVSVSPLNDKIAFTTAEKVWVVNSDGTNLTEVTSASNKNVVGWVDWSPNGTMLTFSEKARAIDEGGHVYVPNWEDEIARVNISVINVDGSNKHVIYNDGYSSAWSPVNSSLIAFIRSACARAILYILNVNVPIDPDPDNDGDGLSDLTEICNSVFDPLDPTDIDEDYDTDGLTNLEEFRLDTYLLTPDTDGDGLSDGVEVKVFKTDPRQADTDGDGVSDGLEAAATGLSAFVSVLPEGWIRIQLQWKNNTMFISTNSSVLGVVFNSTGMALSVSVGGLDGSVGITNITVPVTMIGSLSAVKITLDNQPIDFTISQVGDVAQIRVQYHHSFHQLTAELAGGGGIPLNIATQWWLILMVVGVAAVIGVITVLFRKNILYRT